MNRPLQRWAAAAAAGLTLASAAMAADPPAVPVRSGGVSVDEFAELNRQASAYSLKLILAAKGSGAYLADVDVVVRELPSRSVVLEHRSEGPLVLASLPPGRYEVAATYGQVRPGALKTQTRTVSISPSALAQRVMYFDTGDEVSAGSPPEFNTR
ncbi:MAG: hypothetical protein HZC37_31595 [Burkholderiales bacterium]|nr:hypothetical protein [Burkholderiales bacterium]